MAHTAQQLILHFGLPKTGTSAIQRALFEQREAPLKNHNALAPQSIKRLITACKKRLLA